MELLVPAVTLQLWDIQTELRKAKAFCLNSSFFEGDGGEECAYGR